MSHTSFHKIDHKLSKEDWIEKRPKVLKWELKVDGPLQNYFSIVYKQEAFPTTLPRLPWASSELHLWISGFLFLASMAQHSVWSHTTSYVPLRCSYGLETEQYLSTKWCSSGGQCDMTPQPHNWVPCISPVVGGGWERLKLKLIALSYFQVHDRVIFRRYSIHVKFTVFIPQTQTKSIHTQPPHSSWRWPFSLPLWNCWLRANM